MPNKPSPAKSSHADLLADAAAAWAEAAPRPKLYKAKWRKKVDYTVDMYAEEFELSHQRAQSYLLSLTKGEKAKFDRAIYRIDDRKQGEYVYWPIVAGPPG